MVTSRTKNIQAFVPATTDNKDSGMVTRLHLTQSDVTFIVATSLALGHFGMTTSHLSLVLHVLYLNVYA